MAYSDCVHKDDLKRLTAEVNKYSKEKNRMEYVHKPYRIVTKDRKVKTIEDKTSVDRDKKGNVTYYHGTLTDIT